MQSDSQTSVPALTDTLLQPTRFKIALHLAKLKEEEYIEQIAAAVKEDPRLVSHHLDKMEDLGLAKSEFRIVESADSNRGFAGRFFQPTPKLKAALQTIGALVATKEEGG